MSIDSSFHDDRAFSPDVPTQPPARNSIWIGPAGLRAGWSLCLFVLIAMVMAFGVAVVVGVAFVMTGAMGGHHAKPKFDPHAWYVMFLGEALGIGIILGATAMMGLIEQRRFATFGLGGSSRRWKQLGWGAFWGFASFALLLGLLAFTHAIKFENHVLTGSAILTYGLAWLLTFASVGFLEEVMFRGYVQYTLSRGIGHQGWGFWITAAILSFGFGAIHAQNPGETPVGVFAAGLIGFVLCLSLWYTKSLWWAIGFHTIWDWSQSYIFGVADSGILVQGHLLTAHPVGNALFSGGATGPEGSIFVLSICLFVAGVIFVTLRKERRDMPQTVVPPIAVPAASEAVESGVPWD